MWHKNGHSRAFKYGEELPILNLAARNGFWSISVSPLLRMIATSVGCDLSDANEDFDIVFTLVKFVEKCSDWEATQCCSQRLFHVKKERHTEDILNAEEALDVLSKQDQQMVLKANSDTKNKKNAMTTYADQLKAKKRSLREAKGKGRGRGRGKGRGKGKADAPTPLQEALEGKAYPKEVPSCDLDQVIVKRFMPPGCFCWRANTTGAWQGHYRIAKRYYNKPWLHYGSRGAALALCKDMWIDWLMFNLFDKADCPIAGLLDEAEALPVGSGASGSAA